MRISSGTITTFKPNPTIAKGAMWARVGIHKYTYSFHASYSVEKMIWLAILHASRVFVVNFQAIRGICVTYILAISFVLGK